MAERRRRKKRSQSFHQAAYGYAAEWSGSRQDVWIGGERFTSAISVALRSAPLDDQVQGDVAGYELTLFHVHGHGQWVQIVFSPRGDVLTETIGDPSKPPKISGQREVF